VKKILLLAVLLCGCEEKIEQREGFGTTYSRNGVSWYVVPVTVDGHKYILATNCNGGSCAICPAIEGK
jgi:hypothetical protein